MHEKPVPDFTFGLVPLIQVLKAKSRAPGTVIGLLVATVLSWLILGFGGKYLFKADDEGIWTVLVLGLIAVAETLRKLLRGPDHEKKKPGDEPSSEQA